MQTSRYTRPPRFALIALSGCYFTLATGSLSVVGLLGPMSAGLGVSEAAIAFLVTAFALTYAVAAPLLQMLIGAWDRRQIVLMGLVAIAGGAVVNAIAWSYEVATAGRILMAIGASVVGPVSSAAGAALVPPEQRGAALGTVFSGMTIATVLGVPLTAFLGDLIGWRATLIVIALLALAVATAIFLTVPAGSRGARASGRAIAATLTDRVLAPAISVTLFQMAAQFATYAVITAYLVQRFGVTVTLIPAALFVFGIGGIVGNWVATRLVDRVGPNRLILCSLASTAVIFSLIQAAPADPIIALMLMAGWSVSGMALFAPQQARLVALAPESGNLLLALNASAIYLGMAGGAALSGILYARSGSDHLALASAGLVALGIGAFLLSTQRS